MTDNTAQAKVIYAQAVMDNGDGTLRVDADGRAFVLDLRKAKWSAPARMLDMDAGAGKLIKAVREKRSADALSPRALIEMQIREAGQTLRNTRMPDEVVKLGKVRCALPEYVAAKEDMDEDVRRTDVAVKTSTPPTADQLDQLDQVIDWVLLVQGELGDDYRRVLGGKMNGWGVRRIAANHETITSKSSVARAWNDIVDLILEHLSAA